jgi:tRNA pseudouridine55 synthase
MNIIINLDKSEGISSHQAVQEVKRIYMAKKAGHAGTLDPLATGVLLVCLNEATKITRFLSDLDKEYIVRLKLGERTDTLDSTGTVIEKTEVFSVNEPDVRKVLKTFTGLVRHVPPMYSAIKIKGQPLYKLARKGLHIDRPEREVNIEEMELLRFESPYADLRISCSKGTYIRTLCEDIGNALGVGGHMVSLRRTRTGSFLIEDAVSMKELRNRQAGDYSIDDALSHLPECILDADSCLRAKNGVPVMCPPEFIAGNSVKKSQNALNSADSEKDNESEMNNIFVNQYVRLKSPENVIFGIGKIDKNMVKIERLLN